MKGFFFSLFFLFSTQIIAQSAYDQWEKVQYDKELHLSTDYKEKRIYSSKGAKENLLLRQWRIAKKGRLLRDMVYKANSTIVVYDLSMDYQTSNEVIGTNALDSSKVTYSLTKEGKIRYYVNNRKSTMHIIYTYNDDGQLIRCKDCLNAPRGDEWCLYYTYAYNKAKQLVGTRTYNLKKNQAVEDKVLYAKDSLVYNNGQLSERWALMPTGEPVRKMVYHYDKKGRLEQVAGQLIPPYQVFRNYTVLYDYHCNGKIKKERESYYLEGAIEYRRIINYDKKGRKKQQEGFNAQGERTSLYVIKYK